MNRRALLANLGIGLAALRLGTGLLAQGASFGLGIDGQPVTTLRAPDAQWVVLLFLATDCPISNRYLPEIARLSARYRPRGVCFWAVYPNPGDTLATVRESRRHYPVTASLNALVSPNPQLLRRSRVHVTPEAAIFAADWATDTPAIWHGRIDDRYLTFGRQRPAATRHDLADALDAVLTGSTPAPPPAPPVGCAILPRA